MGLMFSTIISSCCCLYLGCLNCGDVYAETGLAGGQCMGLHAWLGEMLETMRSVM